MRIYVEHDAAMLAKLSRAARPSCDGLILRHGQADEVLAASVRGNILSRDWLLDADLPSDRVICWSGSLAEDMFAAHPPNWLRPGRDALTSFCRDVTGQLRSHQRTLCFQPHSRHVLSDAASSLSLLREHDGGPFEIALSPATMFEPSMLADIEDHLSRMFQSLGRQCTMVIMGDVIEATDADGATVCDVVPLGAGRFPQDLARGLIREFVPPDTPVVLAPQLVARQIEWLGDLA